MGAYPHVRLDGTPRERGRAYGEAVRDRVQLTVEAYRNVFGCLAGWEWARVTQEAGRFAAPIEAFGSKYLEELRGIAEGADLPLEDVLAINVRTEVMFAAKARRATESRAAAAPQAPGRGGSSMPKASTPRGECSSFAALPEATGNGTIVGQTWDWLLHTFETVVVLEVRQSDGPDYVTMVEAGLLAKTGMNSSGIGLATNALVTEADLGEPGVPYHVILRAILDAETIADALAVPLRAARASSAGYLIGHEDGLATYAEAAPGDFSRVYPLFPEDGVLLHTNHFLSPGLDVKDVSLWAMPDSPFRLERLRALTGAERPLTVDTFREALADHAGFPAGVCCHPDPRLPIYDNGATVYAAIMELGARRLWLADGKPCEAPFRELDYGDFLSKPSPVRADLRVRV